MPSPSVMLLLLLLLLLVATPAAMAWRRAVLGARERRKLERAAPPRELPPAATLEPAPVEPEPPPTCVPSASPQALAAPTKTPTPLVVEPPKPARARESPDPSALRRRSEPRSQPVVHKSIKALRVFRPAIPPYPVVLVHGVLGFDAIEVGALRQEYFRGVAKALRAEGVEVHVVRVSPVSSIAVRASQLARQVGRLKARKFNLVAHSMGGLDARYAIARLGLSERVASLTTIGTPHAGTPIADRGVALLAGGLRLRRMLGKLGADAFEDLTTEKMAEFNREFRDTRGVQCASYVGAVKAIMGLNVLLIPAHLALSRAVGDNDGIVPAASQRWGDDLGEIDADHWAQIGWSATFDATPFYRRVVRELRERGL